MRRKMVLVLAMLVVMSVATALPVDAKGPLGGEMELYFNLGFGITDDPDTPENEGAPCPGVSWAGTVELDGDIYGIAFFPTGAKDVGKVHHFAEDWEIYDTPFTFTGGVLTECAPGAIVLSGTDVGVSSPNSTYRMNGTVEEAVAPFVQWNGRNVHMSGEITWQDIEVPDVGLITVPATAPGYFRIN